MYGRRWNKARLHFLSLNPWCVFCAQIDKMTRATVVDHIKPHRGDELLFWDESNWQPLCKLCHDSTKQAYEKSGHVRGCGLDGVPLDPGHHWKG